MKNKLFYLFGAAFLLCSISMFTACSDDDGEPIIEKPTDEPTDDPADKLNINGEYSEANEKSVLKMTYNGEELTGKKVTIKADEDNKTATIELEGTEKDLGAMLYNLLDLKVTTNSPIPGEKKVTLEKVALTSNEEGTAYSFEGTNTNPIRTMTYKGTIKEGELAIDVTNMLARKELAGTWDVAEIPISGGAPNNVNNSKLLYPLWIDWDSSMSIDAGIVMDMPLKAPAPLLIAMAGFVGPGLGLDFEGAIKNLLYSVTAQPNGCMFAKYSYSNDISNPQWSEEMSRNIIRYYYGSEPNQIYIEANIDFVMNALGGLISASKTRSDSEPDLSVMLQQLAEILKPVLENGFPCFYELNGEKMSIHLDGKFTLNLLKKVVAILNEPNINALIMNLLNEDETLKTYAPNIASLIRTLPAALTYKGNPLNPDDDSTWDNPIGTCEFVKIGLQLVKASE